MLIQIENTKAEMRALEDRNAQQLLALEARMNQREQKLVQDFQS